MADQYTYNCPLCGKPSPNPVNCGCASAAPTDTDREKAGHWLESNLYDWPKEAEESLARFRAEAVVEGMRLAADQLEKGLAGHTRSARNTLISRARNLRALADERTHMASPLGGCTVSMADERERD